MRAGCFGPIERGGEQASGVRLILARHGRVAAPWPDRIYGDMDVPLDFEGERQSRGLATALAGCELDAVVSSGLERAEYAAAFLREPRGLPRRDEPDLREIHRGRWAGLSVSELARREPVRWEAFRRAGNARRAPGGESPEEVLARVQPVFDRIAREHAGGTVAVVAHRWVIGVAVSSALGRGAELAARLELAYAGLAVVDWPTEADRARGSLTTVVAFGIENLR